MLAAPAPPYNSRVMQFQILIEHPNQNGFVASVIGVPDCVATASTEEEAIAGVRQALQAKLSRAKIVTIEVELPTAQDEEKPWTTNAGAWQDDPTFDDLMQKIEEYRRETDARYEEGELEVPQIKR